MTRNREIKRKMRRQAERKAKVIKWLKNIGVVFLGVFLFVAWFQTIVIRANGSEALAIAFKYLSIPVAIATFAYFHWFDPDWRQGQGSWRIFYTLFAALMVVWILSGYIQIINAYIPPRQKVIVEGRVVDMYEFKSRKEITVLTGEREKIKVEVTDKEFEMAKLGKMFQKEMRRGCLGILYSIDGLMNPEEWTVP